MSTRYHVNKQGVLSRCRAQVRCPLGGSSVHYSDTLVAKVSNETYTPKSQLSERDIILYQEQNPLREFAGLPPGTDVTEKYECPPVVETMASGATYETPFSYFHKVEKVITVDDHTAMVFVDQGYDKRKVMWLIESHEEGKKTVGMVKVMTEHRQDGVEPHYLITSIEVRPEYRGKGYTRRLAEGLKFGLDKPVYSNGHYTPEGARLASIFPETPPKDAYDEKGVQFQSMDFVGDWGSFRFS